MAFHFTALPASPLATRRAVTAIGA